MKKELFGNNRAEINVEQISYDIYSEQKQTTTVNNEIVIKNPHELKLRTDKVLAKLLDVSRSKIKELERAELISFTEKYIGKMLVVRIEEQFGYCKLCSKQQCYL